MATATEYPLTMFGTTGRALNLLGKEGVDPLQFLQRLIDDTSFRNKVAACFDPSLEKTSPPKAVISDDLHLDCLQRLIKDVFSPLLEHQELDEVLEYETRYNSIDGLRKLIVVASQRDFEFLSARYGLIDDNPLSISAIAEIHNLTSSFVRGRIKRTLHWMKMRARFIERNEYLEQITVESVGIELLGLSVVTGNSLRRAGIYTIPELVEKTDDTLLNISYFGEGRLAEVKQKLAERGQSLKQ